MKLSVVIPVFNEVGNIEEILKRVKATKLASEIVVVDDGSQDGTPDLLKRLDGRAGYASSCTSKIRVKELRFAPGYKPHAAM